MQDNTEDFDFNYWSNLYKKDSDKFEQERLAALQKIVDEAPTEESKHRLEQTMFRIKYNKAAAKNELHSCIKASNLMWEGFHKLNNKLQDFTTLNQKDFDIFIDLCNNPPEPNERLKKAAKVYYSKKFNKGD